MRSKKPWIDKPVLGWIALVLGILVFLVFVGITIASFNQPSDQVAALTPQPDGYDLAADACQADWYYPSYMMTLSGNRLVCASKRLPSNGLVLPLETVLLSTGETVGPALWIEKAVEKEFLGAEYPLYALQPGDHFTARIGCAQDQAHCDTIVVISFVYEDRRIAEEDAWVKISYDQPPVDVDIDLSDLAGEQISVNMQIFPYSQDSSLCQVTIIAPRIGQ